MESLSNSKKIFSVSEISHQIRNRLESSFPSLWIKGELSNFTAHSSGHWYFSLKDQNAQIKGVMFKGQNQKLSFRPQTGEEILAQGQISSYPPRGDYQIICYEMEIVGSGLLQQKFERLKKKLREEGLFDKERKRPIPPFPRHIALVTSPEGAAVRDILQVLKRRFRGIKVTVIPALVQGERAPKSLLKGLELSKRLNIEALIIGRGGGSMEDLWAFNDEELVRAIARHPIPVISAVGHEIDFTLCDFAADLRAPAPSAAAEMVAQSADELLKKLSAFKKGFAQSLNLKLRILKDKIFLLEKGLSRPDRLIQDFFQKLDEAGSRLNLSLKQSFEKSKERLERAERILISLDPKKVMKRGFALVTNEKGEPIFETKGLKIKERLHIEFFKGWAKASVTEKDKGG